MGAGAPIRPIAVAARPICWRSRPSRESQLSKGRSLAGRSPFTAISTGGSPGGGGSQGSSTRSKSVSTQATRQWSSRMLLLPIQPL